MAIIVKINIPYDATESVKAMTDEQYASLCSALVFKELTTDRRPTYFEDYIAPFEEALVWFDHGINVGLKKLSGVSYGEKWAAVERAFDKGEIGEVRDAGTSITNVSVSSVGLFDVQRVMVLEDACTDLLQTHLAGGWRIIAVCPPNDSRRPDYVLGAIGPELD